MTLYATTTTRKSRYSRGPEALDKVDALIKEKMQRDPRSRLEYLAHELLHEISEQLYALRKEAGLTQQELADKIDIPQSFIARLESPYTTNKHPSLPTLAKVAAALGRKLVVRFEKPSDSSAFDVEGSSLENKVVRIEPEKKGKRLSLLEPLAGDSRRRAVAGATSAHKKKEDLEKIEGCDIVFYDVLYTFYTDRKNIYLCGLTDNKSNLLVINGKEYRLRWDQEKNMHLVTDLPLWVLGELVKRIKAGDEHAFEVR